MTEHGFREMFRARQERVDSCVCVGLDPLSEKKPAAVSKADQGPAAYQVVYWMQRIVDATAEFACMFKPQRAHWEAMYSGEDALREVISYIHERYPDIPVFLDCKRGDISKTQMKYAEALWGLDGANGVNFSPYMGRDCMSALIHPDYPGNSIVGLCYTSNPAAREIQDLPIVVSGKTFKLWEIIALKTLKWAQDLEIVENAGLVMAAAYKPDPDEEIIYSQHLVRCRELVGDKLWFLIPGIGAQGGLVRETVLAAYSGPGSMAINSSSGICMASTGDDYEAAAAAAARKLRDEIRAAMPH